MERHGDPNLRQQHPEPRRELRGHSLAIGIAHAADAPGGVVVNGQASPAATVRTLEQAYRVPIAPGRYWYDAVSRDGAEKAAPSWDK